MSAIRTLISAALIALAVSPAVASGNNKAAASGSGSDCAVDYTLFETAIPHVDLEACPASMGFGTDDHVFCRASAGGDMLTVYAFDEGGFQCLRALRSYEPADYKIEVK